MNCSNLYIKQLETESTGLLTVDIAGPKGTVRIHQVVWIEDRQDLLEIFYWESWAVLQGAYHCCFSLPGKVLLVE